MEPHPHGVDPRPLPSALIEAKIPANPTPGGDISGITANNAKRTIVIRMAKPRGDFLTILALLFAAPVPAARFMASSTAIDRPIPGHASAPIAPLL